MTSLLREIEKALDTLSPDKLEEVARDAQRATADFQRWVPNPGPQPNPPRPDRQHEDWLAWKKAERDRKEKRKAQAKARKRNR